MVSKILSVRLLQILTPIISGLAEQYWLKYFLGHLWQNENSQFFLFVGKVAHRAGAQVQNSNSGATSFWVSTSIRRSLLTSFFFIFLCEPYMSLSKYVLNNFRAFFIIFDHANCADNP